MTQFTEESARTLGPEEVKALLRAYAALALAQRAAEQFSQVCAPDARLASLVKCQALAARELDCLLEEALSDFHAASAAPSDAEDSEEECLALVM